MGKYPLGLEPISIEGEDCYTIKQYACAVSRSEASIRQLLSKGNRIRKLKVLHVGEKPYIPFEEVFKFPFTMSGRCDDVYYYIFADGKFRIADKD